MEIQHTTSKLGYSSNILPDNRNVFSIRNKTVSMDFRFTSNLDFLAKLIQNKFDGVGIVDGMEGSG